MRLGREGWHPGWGGVSAQDRPRLLIVEEGLRPAGDVAAVLRRYGFTTARITDRGEALHRAEAADLVVVDLPRVDADRLEFCARLAHRVPLLVISGQSGETDRVPVIEAGADDYVTRPVPPRELVARCRSVLRRAGPQRQGVVRTGDLEIDIDRYEARLGGRRLRLTTKELCLLVALARHPGLLVRREELAKEIWGAGLRSVNRSLNVHVSSLRRKLGDSPHRSRYIQTLHGYGFRLMRGYNRDSGSWI